MKDKIKYLFFAALLMSLSIYGQFNPQNNEITKRFFPDPDLEINTPAFGKKGFTNYDDLMGYLNKLVVAHPSEIALSFIGESQKNKKIPMVVLNRDNGQEKIKVWFQGGLHGDEPAGTETMLYLLDKILNDSKFSYLLDKITLTIVPMANIDGYENLDRDSANGLDLNRDQVKLMAPESNYLKKAFSDFGAEVAVDFHEYRPFRKDFKGFGTNGICSYYDAMFMFSGNLNLPQKLRDYTKDVFVENAKNILESNKLTTRYYITTATNKGEVIFKQCTSEARSSTTSYALTNCISALIEIRGVDLQKTSFKRRINATFLIATSFLKTAYDDAEKIKEVLRISTNAKPENLIVLYNKPIEKQTIKAISLDDNTEIVLDVKVSNALKCEPILERKRPFAYLILPEQKILVDKLIILGLDVEELAEDKTVKVDRYTVTSRSVNAEEDEGYKAQTVETSLSTIEKYFPKGTFIVYLNQKNAKVATEVLEPESENGFIKFEVLDTVLNEELPIYRYLNNEKI